MAYTPVPTKADGDAAYTAADINTYIRDNWLAGLPDLFAAKGDLVSASTADVGVKLAKGTNGYLLLSSAGQIAWGVHPTKDPVTTKGDILGGTAAETVARLAVGKNGAYLKAASGETTGLKWSDTNGAAKNTGDTSVYDADTWTTVQFDAESFDVAGYLSVTTFTPGVTGYYFVSAYIQFANKAFAINRNARLGVYVGASTELSILGDLWGQAAATYSTALGGADILYLTAGQLITIKVYPTFAFLTAADAHVSFIRLGM